MLRVVFGYNQKMILELGLNYKHLAILDYIRDTAADPSRFHRLDKETNVLFASFDQQRIIDDLPTLDFGIYHLRHVLADLVRLELIQYKSFANEGIRGSKTYYALTDKYWSLFLTNYGAPKMEPHNDQELKKAPDIETRSISEEEASGAKKSSSSNPIPLISNNTPNTIIADKPIEPISQLADKADRASRRKSVINEREQGEKEKPKKQDLYTKCVKYIMEYTDYYKLQKALVRYLGMLLELHRSEKKPIYFNMFVGKLNRLNSFPEEDRLEIVELATSNGWKNFYPLEKKATTAKDRKFKDDAVSNHYTEEELKELEKKDAERRARGLQTKF